MKACNIPIVTVTECPFVGENLGICQIKIQQDVKGRCFFLYCSFGLECILSGELSSLLTLHSRAETSEGSFFVSFPTGSYGSCGTGHCTGYLCWSDWPWSVWLFSQTCFSVLLCSNIQYDISTGSRESQGQMPHRQGQGTVLLSVCNRWTSSLLTSSIDRAWERMQACQARTLPPLQEGWDLNLGIRQLQTLGSPLLDELSKCCFGSPGIFCSQWLWWIQTYDNGYKTYSTTYKLWKCLISLEYISIK